MLNAQSLQLFCLFVNIIYLKGQMTKPYGLGMR